MFSSMRAGVDDFGIATTPPLRTAHASAIAIPGDKDALLKQQGKFDMTALMWAAETGNTNGAITLLNAAKDKHLLAQLRDDDDMTAVMIAAHYGHHETAEAIQTVLGGNV